MLKTGLMIACVAVIITVTVIVLKHKSSVSEGEFFINPMIFNDELIATIIEKEGQIYVTVINGEAVTTVIETPAGQFSITANQDRLEIDFNGNVGIFNGNNSMGAVLRLRVRSLEFVD